MTAVITMEGELKMGHIVHRIAQKHMTLMWRDKLITFNYLEIPSMFLAPALLAALAALCTERRGRMVAAPSPI